jgi:3-keto-disaccharide hydrolase
MKKALLSVLCFVLCIGGLYCCKIQSDDKQAAAACAETGMDGISLKGFTSLFDGETLNGWRKLTEYGGDHGDWQVIDGAITGDQYPEGKGGLLVTKTKYSNFEVYGEVRCDYPLDSGFFLRVQPDVLSYQITIDYRPGDGEVGAVYIPGAGGFAEHCEIGKYLWKDGRYNTVRTRIWGQPPHILVWINGSLVMDYIDNLVDEKPKVPESGFFGIQVHPGESWGAGNKVKFRKIMIKEL